MARKKTTELINAYKEYYGIFGDTPEAYDDVDVNAFEYDEYLYIILECINRKNNINEI